MKNRFLKKMLVLASICAVSIPLTANAAEVEIQTEPIKKIEIQSKELIDDTYTFKLNMNEPVEVTFPDGHTEVFEYKENNSNTRSNTYQVGVQRTIWTSTTMLWADAVFENRSVTLLDAYLDFYGVFSEVEGDAFVVQGAETAREGDGTYAKARARGTVVCLQGTRSFDHQMWVDPANSEEAMLRIIV